MAKEISVMSGLMEFDTVILQNGDMDAAYVEVPFKGLALLGTAREDLEKFVFLRPL